MHYIHIRVKQKVNDMNIFIDASFGTGLHHAKKKPRRDGPGGAQGGQKSQSVMYSITSYIATEISALGLGNRKFLRLLGGSRHDIAFRSQVAAVFPGYCPAAPTIPAHESPRAAGDAFVGIKKSRVQVRPFLPVALEPGNPRNGKKLGVLSPG